MRGKEKKPIGEGQKDIRNELGMRRSGSPILEQYRRTKKKKMLVQAKKPGRGRQPMIDQWAQQYRKAGNTGRVLWEPPAGMTGRSLKGHSALDESYDMKSTSPTWGPQMMVVG